MADFTEADAEQLGEQLLDVETQTQFGNQSASRMPAADRLMLLEHVEARRHHSAGGSRFRYYRLTGGYRGYYSR